MKGNSYLLVDSMGNLNSLDYRVTSNNEKSLNDFPIQEKSNKIKEESLLNQFWKRLILFPLSIKQNQNAGISSILEEERDMLISDSIKLVLSKELELSLNSEELIKALEDSVQIFHEDYPYDFILKYKEHRLGMVILDRCINSEGEEKLIYRFNPHIKSFRGLY